MNDPRDLGTYLLMLCVLPLFGVVFAIAVLFTFPIWLPYIVIRRFHD